MTKTMHRLNKEGSDEFFSEAIDCQDGQALIFISNKLLRECIDTKEMFIDGTFRTVPTMFMQLVTIHLTGFSHVSCIS